MRVYSSDNGWGLFKDESSEARGQARKYRRTYTWNSRNQLVSTIDSNYSTSYVYGQDGQRSNKYTQGSETLYFNKMWTLHTDNGNSVYGGQYAKNVYLGETRIVTKLARADQKTAHEEMYKQYYYHSDHLGSATMISDWEGKEYQRIEYTPYGETWVEKTNNSGSEFLPYKFTGKEVDQETGLYYYGARYLDPKYSMWISTDPALGEYIPEMGKGNAKDSGSLPGMGGVYNHINFHLYHYAGNNPVRFVDPDGRAHFSKRPLKDTENLSPVIKWIMSWKIFDFFNLELVHEHLFSDDDSGFNIGWTWGDYTFKTAETKEYTKTIKYFDDNLIKQAVANIQESRQTRKNKVRDAHYSLAGNGLNNFLVKNGFIDPSMVGHKKEKKNNCQDYASKIRKEYYRLYWKLSSAERREIRKTAREYERAWRQGKK